MSFKDSWESFWERQKTLEARGINIDWYSIGLIVALFVGAAVFGILANAIGPAITGDDFYENGSANWYSFGVGVGMVILLILAIIAVWSLISYVWFRTRLRDYLATHSIGKWKDLPENPTNEDILDAIYILNWSNEYRAMKSESRQLLWAFVVAVLGFTIALGADVFGVATVLQDWLGWSP